MKKSPIFFTVILITALTFYMAACDTSGSSSSSSGCDGGAGTEPTPTPSPTPTPTPGTVVNSNIHGTYAMVAAHSGKALDTWEWGITDGTNIAQYNFWGGDCQKFNIARVDGIWHRITPVIAPGQALDVTGCATDSGANIETWTYWGGECQQFRFQGAGTDQWRIIARNSGKCLTVLDAATADGANVIQNDCVSGADHQIFQLSGGNGGPGNAPITVYVAGDSTVATYTDTSSSTDQAGWGQMLHLYYNSAATVDNRAIGGRTARWFYMEGRLESIMTTIKPGDYLLVQFGHNDSHTTATFTVGGVTYQRYADPDTDFKNYLYRYYILPARAHGAIPVLVTPPPRNSAYCTGGNSLARWAQAMRELGEAYNVAVVDLNQKTLDYLIPICPSPTPENFYFIKTDGTVDGTHFQENGARILADFVAEGIEELDMGLADYGL